MVCFSGFKIGGKHELTPISVVYKLIRNTCSVDRFLISEVRVLGNWSMKGGWGDRAKPKKKADAVRCCTAR